MRAIKQGMFDSLKRSSVRLSAILIEYLLVRMIFVCSLANENQVESSEGKYLITFLQ